MAKQRKKATVRRLTPSKVREADREYNRLRGEYADVVQEAIATVGSRFTLADLIGKAGKLASNRGLEYSPCIEYQVAALCEACEGELASLVSAGGIRVELLYSLV